MNQNHHYSSQRGPSEMSLPEPDVMFFQHLKNRLQLLNKRRHVHPIDIIHAIRSKVSFPKILKLHDDQELQKMDHLNEMQVFNYRITQLEKTNKDQQSEIVKMQILNKELMEELRRLK